MSNMYGSSGWGWRFASAAEPSNLPPGDQYPFLMPPNGPPMTWTAHECDKGSLHQRRCVHYAYIGPKGACNGSYEQSVSKWLVRKTRACTRAMSSGTHSSGWARYAALTFAPLGLARTCFPSSNCLVSAIVDQLTRITGSSKSVSKCLTIVVD